MEESPVQWFLDVEEELKKLDATSDVVELKSKIKNKNFTLHDMRVRQHAYAIPRTSKADKKTTHDFSLTIFCKGKPIFTVGSYTPNEKDWARSPADVAASLISHLQSDRELQERVEKIYSKKASNYSFDRSTY